MKPFASKILAYLPIIGLLLLAIAFLAKQLGANELVTYFFVTVGALWIIVGLVGLAVRRFNPRLIKTQEIDQRDERSISLREKSGLLTCVVAFVVLDILIIALLIMGYILPAILVGTTLVILVVTFLLAQTYYAKKL